jgi:hypothetical protein
MTNMNNKVNLELDSLENVKILQIEALKALQASRMKSDEKEMWFAMLPYMEESQLKRFIDILQKENKEVVNLYFSFLQ